MPYLKVIKKMMSLQTLDLPNEETGFCCRLWKVYRHDKKSCTFIYCFLKCNLNIRYLTLCNIVICISYIYHTSYCTENVLMMVIMYSVKYCIKSTLICFSRLVPIFKMKSLLITISSTLFQTYLYLDSLLISLNALKEQ